MRITTLEIHPQDNEEEVIPATYLEWKAGPGAEPTGPDPTMIAPHFENFSDVNAPDLPYGWEKIVLHSNPFAAVRTTNSFSPNSDPYHAELFNTFYGSSIEAHLLLITPEVDTFENRRLRFYAKKTGPVETTIQIGTMSNHLDLDSFNQVDSNV